jgi:cysteine-rich repeat protein
VLAACLVTAVAARAAAPPFPGLNTATATNSDGDLPIPDNDSLVSTVVVSGAPGAIVDVDVTLDIAHTQPDQLDIFLVSPRGTTVTLTTDNGGNNDDIFAPVTFDDQAPGTPSAANVRNVVFANAVPVGTVQPEEALGELVGEPAEGQWALVVVDDSGGQEGTLRGWSVTVSTVIGIAPSVPVSFDGSGLTIPDTAAEGVSSQIQVSSVGTRLYHVALTVDIRHPRANDIDLFLTAPSGRRIDVVTDVGQQNVDLYAGTTFDAQAGAPASDTTLPPSGTAFGTVAGEGALSAFMGEDPNGTWTLTVADDTRNNQSGTLQGWTLTLSPASTCGDGTVDPGEPCDDGNATEGDGCDSNCTPSACGNGVLAPGEDCDDGNTLGGDACPALCHLSESNCGDCVDDDGNGLIDAADPACQPGELDLRRATVSTPRGKLKLTAGLPAPPTPSGPASVVITDGNGVILCVPLGALRRGAGGLTAATRVGAGRMSLAVQMREGGSIVLNARGLDLSSFDDPNVTVGLTLGDLRFVGSGNFRTRSASKWVHP